MTECARRQEWLNESENNKNIEESEDDILLKRNLWKAIKGKAYDERWIDYKMSLEFWLDWRKKMTPERVDEFMQVKNMLSRIEKQELIKNKLNKKRNG